MEKTTITKTAIIGLFAFICLGVTACPPVIDSIQPAEECIGERVTINGKYFGENQGEVSFNGVEATSFEAWTDNKIITVVPDKAISGPVIVTVNGLQSNVKDFTVIEDCNFTVEFIDSGQRIGNYDTGSIALGDIDGDGDVDLAEGNVLDITRAFKPDRIYRNENGQFVDTGQILGDSATSDLALVDIDNDEDLDLITVGNRDNSFCSKLNSNSYNGSESLFCTFLVYKNNGEGIFEFDNEYPSPLNPSSLAVGDIDGDSDIDAVVGYEYGEGVRVMKNNGGGFSDAGQILGYFHNTTSVALADVNGDGSLDIIAGNEVLFDDTYTKTDIFFNNGDGQFTLGSSYSSSEHTVSTAVGDVDNDGDIDIVEGNISLTLEGVKIYVNDGTGNYELYQEVAEDWHNAYGVTLGDVDKDGDLDLFIGNFFSVNNEPVPSWFFVNNEGVFENSEQNILYALVKDLVLGDIDNDGYLDIVAGAGYSYNIGDYSNRVWLNQRVPLN